MTTKENEILKGEELGKFLSPDLQKYLRTYTDGNDRAMAAVAAEVSMSTITGVLGRKNPLSENNIKAIKELVRLAIAKCEHQLEGAGKTIKKLKAILNES